MEFEGWFAAHWFTLLESAGIIGSLLFTAFSMRAENKTRRISNALEITKNHREIWIEIFDKPELRRVLDGKPDLKHSPVTRAEQIFVNLIILHLNSVFHALEDKLVLKPEGLQDDIGWFFKLPIPRLVWDTMKGLHDDAFVTFVESCFSRGNFSLEHLPDDM